MEIVHRRSQEAEPRTLEFVMDEIRTTGNRGGPGNKLLLDDLFKEAMGKVTDASEARRLGVLANSYYPERETDIVALIAKLVANLVRNAHSYNDLMGVWRDTVFSDPGRDEILRKLVRVSDSMKQALDVLELIPDGHKLERPALERAYKFLPRSRSSRLHALRQLFIKHTSPEMNREKLILNKYLEELKKD